MGKTIQATSITTYRRIVTENQNRITANDPWTTTYSYGSWSTYTDSQGRAVIGGSSWGAYVQQTNDYRYRTHYEYRAIVLYDYSTVATLSCARHRMYATQDGGSSLLVSVTRITTSGNPTAVDTATAVKVQTVREAWSEWDISAVVLAQIDGNNYGLSLGVSPTATSLRYYDGTAGAQLVTDIADDPPSPDNAVMVCVGGTWYDGRITQVYHNDAWYTADSIAEVT